MLSDLTPTYRSMNGVDVSNGYELVFADGDRSVLYSGDFSGERGADAIAERDAAVHILRALRIGAVTVRRICAGDVVWTMALHPEFSED